MHTHKIFLIRNDVLFGEGEGSEGSRRAKEILVSPLAWGTVISGSVEMKSNNASHAHSFSQVLESPCRRKPCFQLQIDAADTLTKRYCGKSISFALPLICKEVKYVTLALYLSFLLAHSLSTRNRNVHSVQLSRNLFFFLILPFLLDANLFSVQSLFT